jgi:hypothetical protein
MDSTPSPDTLSLYTAVCALSAVALNPKSQPSGKMLGTDESWTFFLRASPMVCAYNFTETFCRLVYYCVWRREPPSKAVANVLENCFEGDSDHAPGPAVHLKNFDTMPFSAGSSSA